MRILLLSIILVVSPCIVLATIIHVPDDQPTIQAGIDAAVDNDTVLVAPGTYSVNINFSGKLVKVFSSHGPTQTILQPGYYFEPTITFNLGEDTLAELSGFTITGGMTGTQTISIYNNSYPTIKNNIFNNYSGTNSVIRVNSNALIIRNLFHDNGGESCVTIGSSGDATIRNNTFDNNSNGIYSISSQGAVFNNIISNSTGFGISGSYLYLDYNNLWNNSTDYINGAEAGDNDISHEPLYNNPSMYNYSLQSQSLCIDVGNPDAKYNDPDNTVCDLGVYYYHHTPKTLYVPSEYQNIQEGILASTNSDTVLVAAGLYTGSGNRDINLYGKSIVVKSESGPELCVIDCGGTEYDPHRGFIFQNDERQKSIIEGVTIIGGMNNSKGGGMIIEGASPTIINCNFVGNTIGPSGGFGGGAVYCSNGSSTFLRCEFTDNSVQDVEEGGALLCYQGNVALNNCIFINNSAAYGGAVELVYDYQNPSVIDSCIFINNAASMYGGAMSCFGSSPEISNCTFYGNTSTEGSSIYCRTAASPLIDRCILGFNTGLHSIYCYENDTPCQPEVNCTDIYGNSGGDWTGCIADQLEINNNFSLDPQFCDTANIDLKISETSPCSPENNNCGELIGAYGVGCYICGDANSDGSVNVGDAVFINNFVFHNGPEPDPYEAGDVNCDGSVNLGDAVYLINYIFHEGPEPCAWCK